MESGLMFRDRGNPSYPDTIAYKTADEARANTVTPSVDSELFFDAKSGRKYIFETNLFFNKLSIASKGLRLQVSGTATATDIRVVSNAFTGSAVKSATATALDSNVYADTGDAVLCVRLRGSFEAASNGTLAVSWSSDTLHPSLGATMYRGSNLLVWRVA
jgi:hypothetical protein